MAYRRHVDAAMDSLIGHGRENIATRVRLGLHHEQQHQELILMDVLHLFAQMPGWPAYLPARPGAMADPGPMTFAAFDGGAVRIGHDGPGFAFDNETPRHQTLLGPYRFAYRLVTNAEWAAFIEDDGYRKAELWLSDGWAKVQDEAGPTSNAVRGFLVETRRPGFHAHEIHGKWSLRASLTSGLSLENVHIPAANLLPGSSGLKSPLMCLNQARYGISWGAIGAASACYDAALQYAKLRKQFHNQPIASHQLIQEKLVWMASEIAKAQLLSLHVGRLKDAGKVGHQHISMAKRNNVWMALESARLARDILGANGITEDYPIMRHMMNLESVKTYEGTHDIHTLILGQHLTGIAAY